MKQATTQVEVLTQVFVRYHRWSFWNQKKRTALARIAYRKRGIALHPKEPRLPVIAVAWHEEKERLGRELTSTELYDIEGWAA